MEINKKIPYVAVLISILILTVSIMNLKYNMENQKEKETPKLAILDYGVVSNEGHFRPIFVIKNTGYVPLIYNVASSKITNISFYNSSNAKLLEINANQINLGASIYHNRGGTLLPEAINNFYFSSEDINIIKVPYSYYEATIVFDVDYWNIENPSNVCRLHSIYTFYSIEQNAFQDEQSISCNYQQSNK